eukprot:m.1400455 g.1400455  ORF g.1400455 m.1400455 type:complete len:89 (+) comp25004_c0_seq3:179-445(+)
MVNACQYQIYKYDHSNITTSTMLISMVYVWSARLPHKLNKSVIALRLTPASSSLSGGPIIVCVLPDPSAAKMMENQSLVALLTALYFY